MELCCEDKIHQLLSLKYTAADTLKSSYVITMHQLSA